MKAKKLLATFLAIIMSFSCISIVAFAEETHYQTAFTLNIPSVTVGTTAEQIEAGISFADSSVGNDIEIYDVFFVDNDQNTKDSIISAGQYRLYVTFKIKNITDFSEFAGKKVLSFMSYAEEIFFKGENEFSNLFTMIGNAYDLTTHSISTSGTDGAIYCSASYEVKVPTGVTYLDLEKGDTYLDTKDDIAQNYTLSKTGDFTNKTKVKLTWTITDIAVTVDDDKAWNPDKLKWQSAGSSTASVTDGTARFELDNMSSIELCANASFSVETDLKSSFKEVSFDKNDIKLNTVVGTDTKRTVNKAVVTTDEINATVKVKSDEFKGKSATTEAAKYGTYTVTIGNEFYKVQLQGIVGGNKTIYVVKGTPVIYGSDYTTLTIGSTTYTAGEDTAFLPLVETITADTTIATFIS